LEEIVKLVGSPRHRFSTLRKDAVPETAGLYVLYKEEPLEVLYVGIARMRASVSLSGVSDGLRFRIMENHLAYRGDDNFVKYVGNEFRLTSRAEIRAFLQRQCSVHWMEVPDLRRLTRLEHLAIAALEPKLNRG
jgi:hypothetical protein